MESPRTMSSRHHNLLKVLSTLPQKMLLAHYDECLIERVLYDLAHPDCFNFSKAAYLVDNPDFNCVKGVAGFARDDHKNKSKQTDHWQDPQELNAVMEQSPFHQHVRSYNCEALGYESPKKNEQIKRIADLLHLRNPSSYTWNGKHGNHGILLFEHDEPSLMQQEYSNELLAGVSLLGFCPIY